MDENTELFDNEYTGKEFAKDVGIAVAKTAAEQILAVGILLAIGFAYSKIQDRKAKKIQNKE